jgi:hypothetical protein
MAPILRVKARWSGFTGSPGYSNFYFRDFDSGSFTDAMADAAGDRVETFFGACATLFPNNVRITVQSDAEVIEETNGEIISVLSTGPRSAVAGTAAANAYSAASGVVVTWRTGGVVVGRRVRGRTFLVPTANVAYDLDGTLGSGPMNTIQTAANALAATTGSPDLGVWSRPHKARVAKDGTNVPARDGSWYVVTSVTIPDKVAILKSRRD